MKNLKQVVIGLMMLKNNVSLRSTTLVLAMFLSGCVTMQSHDETASRVATASSAGDFKAGLQQLDGRYESADAKKDLLYNLEKGELLRLDRRYAESTEALGVADQKIKEWEEDAKTNPTKLLGMVGAAAISERLKSYEGQDYEKVWLTTRLALNRIALGDFENARVDIKRTHEREAVIAEFRSKEVTAAEEDAKNKGAVVDGKELGGYPTATLNDPEVLALKNGYQNALSHYLAGFLYEALNEPGLAAPGYRKAIELQPGVSVLEDGLKSLDTRTSFTWKRRQQVTDVLFVVEAGLAPARKPQSFTIPTRVNSVGTLSISYPVIEPSKDPALQTVSVAGKNFQLGRVVDMNLMARRALKDEMPGMIFRGVTRALVKGRLQEEANKRLGPLGGIVAGVVNAATEQADDRMWRSLPGRVYVSRGYLAPGEYKISVSGRDFGVAKIEGQYAMVPLRLYQDTPVLGDVAVFGKLDVATSSLKTSADGNTGSDAKTGTESSTPVKGKQKAKAATPAKAASSAGSK